MTLPLPARWQENGPLYGVALLLALAFAALAIAGPGAERPATGGPLPASPARYGLPDHAAALGALPANADDMLVVTSALDAASAQARNAAVPLAPVGPGLAPPFLFAGGSADRARARDCLALAAMAEAGSGDGDQRAVMQVILNRVRHPAFARSVCGVVYEGSERPTGCQFSFTCDGSLSRRYAESAWAAARRRADEALGGYVHAAVGAATHYHADYVYPWWSSQLDKVARIGPHLFFRWRGFWGTTRALSARYAGREPDPVPLAAVAQAVTEANPLPMFAASGTALTTITAAPTNAVPSAGSAPLAVPANPGAPAPGVHFVLVSAGDSPGVLVERARALCPGTNYCQVYGWDDAAAIPARLPLSGEARAALRFSFLAARSGAKEAIYLDCRIWPAPAPGSCLPRARR